MIGLESLFSLLLGGIFLLVGGWVVGMVMVPSSSSMHNRPHLHPPILVWGEGVMVILLGLPFVLTLGNLLVGVRVDFPTLGGLVFLLLLSGWWSATRTRSRR